MVYFFIGTKLRGANEAQTLEQIRAQLVSTANADKLTCEIKNFKLANLDTLMFINENLIKLEVLIEGNLKKIQRQYLDITENHKVDFQIETSEGTVSMQKFLQNFKWDDVRFKRSVNLNEMQIALQQRVAFAESDLRTKTSQYNEAKSAAQTIAKKEGNLYVKDLSEILRGKIVQQTDFVYSDYLTTLVAIVPKANVEDFLNKYQNLHECVVPGSAKKFEYQEKDLTVWRIVLMTKHYREAKEDIGDQDVDVKKKKKKNQDEDKKQEEGQEKQEEDLAQKRKTPLEEFYAKSRDLKVTFREFKYDPTDYESQEKDRKELAEKVNQFQNILKRSCEISFGDLYSTYIHAKYLRFVVEIAMRIGAQEKFCSCIVQPKEGQEQKVQQILTQIFADPSQMDMYGTKEDLQDTEDFFPFVYVPINH